MASTPSSSAVLKVVRASIMAQGEAARISFQMELDACRPDHDRRLHLSCRDVPRVLDLLHSSHGVIEDCRDRGKPEINIGLPHSFDGGALTLEGEIEWLPGRRQKGSRLSHIVLPSLLPQPWIRDSAPSPQLFVDNDDARVLLLYGPRDSRDATQQITLAPTEVWPLHRSGRIAVLVDPQLGIGPGHASAVAATIASLMSDLGSTFGKEVECDFLAVATEDDTVPTAGGMVAVAGTTLLGIETGDTRVLEIVGVPAVASIWWGGAIASSTFLGVALCQGITHWAALQHSRAGHPPEVHDLLRRQFREPGIRGSHASMTSFIGQMALALDAAETHSGQTSALMKRLTNQYWGHAVSAELLLEEFQRGGNPLSVPSELRGLP